MNARSDAWRNEVHDVCVTTAPSAQAAIDLFSDWSSLFPASAGVKAGGAALFEDSRVAWAIDELGGVRDKTILELGPLEAGHTYMLTRAGARSVTAVEANKRCFLKCLISQNVMKIERATFLLGDFMPYLEQGHSFDVAWVAGVLYHMPEPLRLLDLVGQSAKQLHIWTHYVPDEGVVGDPPWARPIRAVEDRVYDGRTVKHFVRTYFDQGQKAAYCGGVYMASVWLRRADILEALKQAGYSKISISFESPDHPHGPAFAIAASK